jgi:hypothetical protein
MAVLPRDWSGRTEVKSQKKAVYLKRESKWRSSYDTGLETWINLCFHLFITDIERIVSFVATSLYNGRKISANLGYVTERGEGKIERGEQDALCAITSPPLPYLGWLATCVFVTVNGARRYLATSITGLAPSSLGLYVFEVWDDQERDGDAGAGIEHCRTVWDVHSLYDWNPVIRGLVPVQSMVICQR